MDTLQDFNENMHRVYKQAIYDETVQFGAPSPETVRRMWHNAWFTFYHYKVETERLIETLVARAKAGQPYNAFPEPLPPAIDPPRYALVRYETCHRRPKYHYELWQCGKLLIAYDSDDKRSACLVRQTNGCATVIKWFPRSFGVYDEWKRLNRLYEGEVGIATLTSPARAKTA